MASIQIFGVKDHHNTLQLKQNLTLALDSLSLDFPIEEVYEINRLLTAKISGIPALKIGDRIISQEKISIRRGFGNPLQSPFQKQRCYRVRKAGVLSIVQII